MMVRPTLKVALFVGLLAGCATAAQRQGENIKTTIAATREQAKACFGTVDADPAYAELARHYPLKDIRQASFNQQTDASLATPHEIELLSARHDALTPCKRAVVNGYMVAPPIGVVWMDYYVAVDANMLDLAKRHISWGEYVVRGKALFDEAARKSIAAGQQINAGLNAQHRQEMAQRAEAAQAFSNAMYQQQILNQNQQLINSANRPVTTSCNRFGNNVNCTSY